MKNKRIVPIIGILLGFILGLFFEIQIWSLVNNYSGEIIRLPTSPRGGIPFGYGLTTIMTAALGGLIGVIINMIRDNTKH